MRNAKMIKTFYRNNKIKSRLFVAVVILFLFLIVLRIFPFANHYL